MFFLTGCNKELVILEDPQDVVQEYLDKQALANMGKLQDVEAYCESAGVNRFPNNCMYWLSKDESSIFFNNEITVIKFEIEEISEEDKDFWGFTDYEHVYEVTYTTKVIIQFEEDGYVEENERLSSMYLVLIDGYYKIIE